MAERPINVRLVANIAGYKRSLDAAAAQTRGLAKEVSGATGKGAEGYQKLGLASSVAGVAIAAGIGKAITASMSFEKSLSGLRAATGANAAGMELLRTAALKVGKDTAFSAEQAVEAQTALAKAGVSLADVLGGALTGAADLAAAGQLGIADASEIAATAMTQFKLQGQDVPHIADLLAAAAGKAQGEVTDMAAALKYVGPVAGQMGISIEETAGSIALLASNGILGEQAGTSLRGMLTGLTSPSQIAADTMKTLGINVYDASGQFVGLQGVAGQLQGALGGLGEAERDAAFGRLFGNEQITAARVLYAGGAQDVAKWTTAVDDSGYASRTAATMTDNLVGDLERLGGSLTTVLVENGGAANGMLRTLTQTADGAVNVFADLPAPLQTGVTGLSALTGAAALASGAFLLGAPKVAAFKASLDDMGPRSQRFGKGIIGIGSALGGPWGIALAAGVTALGLFGKAKADAAQVVADFTEAISADSGAIGENARAVAVLALEQQGVLASAEKLGLNLETVTEAALGDASALDELRSSADQYVGAAAAATEGSTEHGLAMVLNGAQADLAAGKSTKLVAEVETLAGQLEEGAAASRRQAEALGEGGAATEQAASKTDALTVSTKAAVEALDAQATALRAQYDPLFAMQQAVMQHAEAQNAAKEAVREHGKSSKEAAAAEFEMLEATVGLSAAAAGLTSSVAGNTTSLATAKAQLKQWVGQGLLTQAQADNLAEKIGGLTAKAGQLSKTPATVKVGSTGLAGTDQVVTRLITNVRQLDGMSATVTTVYRSVGMPGSAPVSRIVGVGGGVAARASGGLVAGYTTPTTTEVPA